MIALIDLAFEDTVPNFVRHAAFDKCIAEFCAAQGRARRSAVTKFREFVRIDSDLADRLLEDVYASIYRVQAATGTIEP